MTRIVAIGLLGLGLAGLGPPPAEAATPCGRVLREVCKVSSFEVGYRCLARNRKALSPLCRASVERRLRYETGRR